MSIVPLLPFDNGVSYNFTAMDRLPSNFTFTRASGATAFNSSGSLITVGNDVPRFDFNPATLQPRGLLIEGARTNSIRNSTMVGASSSPSTPPTNWNINSTAGITGSVVGVGVVNGLNYIDVRYQGTASATSGASVQFDGNISSIVAASGQTWVSSAWMALVGGSKTGVNIFSVAVAERNLGTNLATTIQNITSPLSSTLTRYQIPRTFNNASTNRANGFFEFSFTSGAVIDFTIRIAEPQLEQGAFASSIIRTSGTAATRASDSALVSVLSSLGFNPSEGTFVIEVEPMFVNSHTFMRVDDGTLNNAITLRLTSTTNGQIQVINGGVAAGNPSTANGFGSGIVRLAGAYRTNDFAVAMNGGAVAFDTVGAMPSGFSQMSLTVGGSETGFYWLRRLTYYPTRLPDAQLTALTA